MFESLLTTPVALEVFPESGFGPKALRAGTTAEGYFGRLGTADENVLTNILKIQVAQAIEVAGSAFVPTKDLSFIQWYKFFIDERVLYVPNMTLTSLTYPALIKAKLLANVYEGKNYRTENVAHASLSDQGFHTTVNVGGERHILAVRAPDLTMAPDTDVYDPDASTDWMRTIGRLIGVNPAQNWASPGSVTVHRNLTYAALSTVNSGGGKGAVFHTVTGALTWVIPATIVDYWPVFELIEDTPGTAASISAFISSDDLSQAAAFDTSSNDANLYVARISKSNTNDLVEDASVVTNSNLGMYGAKIQDVETLDAAHQLQYIPNRNANAYAALATSKTVDAVGITTTMSHDNSDTYGAKISAAEVQDAVVPTHEAIGVVEDSLTISSAVNDSPVPMPSFVTPVLAVSDEIEIKILDANPKLSIFNTSAVKAIKATVTGTNVFFTRK